MSSGVFSKARSALCNQPEEEDEESRLQKLKHQRQIVKGIFADDADVQEQLSASEQTHFYVEVSVDTLNELRDLNCYDDCSIDGRRAAHFANQHSDVVQVYIQIVDSLDPDDDEQEPRFSIEPDFVGIMGDDVTNERISDFCRRFGRSLASNFDPMAEDHDEPIIAIRPW